MRKRSLSRFLKPTQLNYEFVERFLVLLISVVFIIVNFSKKEEQRYLRNHVVDFFSPINIIFQIPGNQINNLKNWTNNMVNLKEINLELENKLLHANNALSEFYQLKVENEELRSLLNLQIPQTINKVVSRIILDPSDIHSSRVFIDVGFDENIQINSPVFNENGLLGRVIDVKKKSSEVLLLIDPKSSVPVMTDTTKIKFFVEGNMENLSIKHLPENSIIYENELVISTDVSGYFKKGIIVGKVVKDKTYNYAVLPSAKKTDSVYVMTVNYEEQKKILLENYND